MCVCGKACYIVGSGIIMSRVKVECVCFLLMVYMYASVCVCVGRPGLLHLHCRQWYRYEPGVKVECVCFC